MAAKKVERKKLELEGVTALEDAVKLLERRVEGLASDIDVMADSGAVIGQILEQWPHMFRILALVSETIENIEADRESTRVANNPIGERLVRVHLESLQNGDKS